jgi:hypothetical protein
MTVEIALYKTRLAVLWVFAAVCWLVGFSLNLLMPGVVQGLLNGEIAGKPISQWQMTLYAFFYVYPFSMAVLSLTLKGALNRWLNLTMGVIGAVFLILDLGIHALNLVQGGQEAFAIWLTMITGVVVAIVIVWLAWKYPKGE